LTKIIFREFFGFEPAWVDARPDIEEMLCATDAALLIGDPALQLSAQVDEADYRIFDLAELWHRNTGLGFVFAMWMTGKEAVPIDFAAARDEGLAHIDEIIGNYEPEIGLDRAELTEYLSKNISYSIDDSMRRGMELYFELAQKNGLIDRNKPLVFLEKS
jgi:chorismate dehydratase